MTAAQYSLLGIYLAFMAGATLLALFGRRLGARPVGAGLWKKYPLYILLNLVFIAAGWLPREWNALSVLLALLGGLAAWELSSALLPASRARFALAILCAALIASAGWLQPPALIRLWLAALLAAGLAAALAGAVSQLGRRLLAVAGCLVYLPACLAAYVLLRGADAGGFHAVFLYLIIAANDAFAQITGQVFGRRQLAPRLSPGKTVEGALGGLLFAALLGAALGRLVGWGALGGAGAAALIAAAGALGDLTESAWKRALGLKDFSALLGAQGGVLDRFDGLIFAAPVYYLLLSVFSKL
jgi:phosphatidate cytidylyltransferase